MLLFRAMYLLHLAMYLFFFHRRSRASPHQEPVAIGDTMALFGVGPEADSSGLGTGLNYYLSQRGTRTDENLARLIFRPLGLGTSPLIRLFWSTYLLPLQTQITTAATNTHVQPSLSTDTK